MLFQASRVQGSYIIEPERRADSRGFFARTWCQEEFARAGLSSIVVQISISHNIQGGTLRGMHFQVAPHEEEKVVSCTRGAIYDVVLDLRPGSPTYLLWDAVELSARNLRALYIPRGCAHGFQTLEDDTLLLYFMSEFHAPGHARGVRHDDPAFGIQWPLSVTNISDADRTWPDYRPNRAGSSSIVEALS